jgi:predicted branched-subunit amino acid permease
MKYEAPYDLRYVHSWQAYADRKKLTADEIKAMQAEQEWPPERHPIWSWITGVALTAWTLWLLKGMAGY